MTSTCSQSATPETASASLASRAKSADKMLGAIWTAIGPSVNGGPRPARGGTGGKRGPRRRAGSGPGGRGPGGGGGGGEARASWAAVRHAAADGGRLSPVAGSVRSHIRRRRRPLCEFRGGGLPAGPRPQAACQGRGRGRHPGRSAGADRQGGGADGE